MKAPRFREFYRSFNPFSCHEILRRLFFVTYSLSFFPTLNAMRHSISAGRKKITYRFSNVVVNQKKKNPFHVVKHVEQITFFSPVLTCRVHNNQNMLTELSNAPRVYTLVNKLVISFFFSIQGIKSSLVSYTTILFDIPNFRKEGKRETELC